MFPNTKPCLDKETNDSYSRAVIGILVFSTLLVFMVMGVTAFNDFSEHSNRSILPMNSESTSVLEFNNAENIDDQVIKAKPSHYEPAYQTVREDIVYYAEPGSITFVEDNFESDLPICFDMEYGADKWVVIKVCGGYDPRLQLYPGYGYYYGLMILRDADGKIVMNGNMYVGWLLDSYTDVSDQYRKPGCICCQCCVWYNFTIDPYACNNWVCLDSSYQLHDKGEPTLNEDKFYTIEYKTHWFGCEFDKMLAHINCVPESYAPD
ncbi:MAG: hypothetical protein ACFFCE_12435 [Promethearchaeota archaeon]